MNINTWSCARLAVTAPFFLTKQGMGWGYLRGGGGARLVSCLFTLGNKKGLSISDIPTPAIAKCDSPISRKK